MKFYRFRKNAKIVLYFILTHIILNYQVWLIVSILLGIRLYFLLIRGFCRSPKCLVGKTVLITGANAGIGFKTALDIAKRGAKVIIACRDKQRGQQACDDIITLTGNPNVSLQILDLASFDSVRQCAKNLHATEQKLDILINNAGMAPFQTVTEDGLNLTIQVNYCSLFLFTILLRDLLLKSENARVVNLTSALASFGNVEKGQISQTKHFSLVQPYNISKLCVNLFTKELASRIKGTNITTYAVHPGVIRTNIFHRKLHPITKIFLFVVDFFGTKNTYEGAQSSLYCALERGIEKYSGGYFSDCQYVRKYYSEVLAKEVWDETVELLKLKPEELIFNKM